MTVCEFEEKEFEAPLYRELTTTSCHVWAPGLVLERHLGIDYAVHCVDPFLWSLHGIAYSPAGVNLEKLRKLLGMGRPLPNFALNIFLQAKRPTHSAKTPRALRDLGLCAPYWRFKITPHQQERLEALASVCGEDGLVCYASPAFHRLSQLYSNTISGSVAANSTFPRIEELKGHSAWNYACAGSTGVANVDPVWYEGPSLEERVRRLAQVRSDQLRQDPADVLENFAQRLRDSRQVPGTVDDGRSAVFHLRAAEIDSAFSEFPDVREVVLLKNFAYIANYAISFNMVWLTVGASE